MIEAFRVLSQWLGEHRIDGGKIEITIAADERTVERLRSRINAEFDALRPMVADAPQQNWPLRGEICGIKFKIEPKASRKKEGE